MTRLHVVHDDFSPSYPPLNPFHATHKSTVVTLLTRDGEAFYVLRQEHINRVNQYSDILHLTQPGKSTGDYTQILINLLGSLDPILDFEEIDAAFRAYHAALDFAEARYSTRTFSIRAGLSHPPINLTTRKSSFMVEPQARFTVEDNFPTIPDGAPEISGTEITLSTVETVTQSHLSRLDTEANALLAKWDAEQI